MQIGYIGLGAMGGALARRLLLERKLVVFDLNAAAVQRFVQAGASAAASPADLARQCDVILLCLPRTQDVERVLFGPDGVAQGLSAGKVVIDQTSGDPAETAAIARRLAAQDVTLLDGPVSGGVSGAEAGTIAIMVSGPQDTFERILPVLNSISPNVEYCGDRVGNAQALKLVNNVMSAGTRVATLEIVAMGRKMGLDLEVMTDVINKGSGRNRTSMTMLPALAQGKPATNFALALMLKDMNLAMGLGMQSGAPMPITSIVRGLLQTGVNTYGQDARLDDVVQLIESMAGTRIAGPLPAEGGGQ